MLKSKPLIYPFTYKEWLKHPSTKPKIAWCKKVGAEINKIKKYGLQKTLDLV